VRSINLRLAKNDCEWDSSCECRFLRRVIVALDLLGLTVLNCPFLIFSAVRFRKSLFSDSIAAFKRLQTEFDVDRLSQFLFAPFGKIAVLDYLDSIFRGLRPSA